jgi:serine/threonine protein kinase
MDRYRRINNIASGSHGVVDLVQDVETKRYAVMKTIAIGGASRVSSLSEAKKEADLLRSLRHPNIIHLIDSFVRSRSEFVIVLEYADAQDLQRYTDSNPNIPERTVVRIFIQIILALAYLHSPSVRVIHRDLKAANIFLFKNRLVKLGDFGISRELRGEQLAQTLIGTPYFMCPELIQQQPYGYPADIWAAGCILFELMTGQRAFQGHTPGELFAQIVIGRTPEIPGSYSPKLKCLVAHMLCKDPARRPTADDILAMPFLQDALDSLEADMRGEDRPKPPARPDDDADYPAWIRDNHEVRDDLIRQSFRQLRDDAAALVDVVRSSAKKVEAAVALGPIQSDLPARRRRLEADARRMLGKEKYEIAYGFIRKNFCENRQQLAALLGLTELPAAINLVDGITMIERYEQQ